MYIRRKVFSVLTDEFGEERYFSTTQFMNEEDYLEMRNYTEVYDANGNFLGDAYSAAPDPVTGKKAKGVVVRDQAYYDKMVEEGGFGKTGAYGVSGELSKAEREFMNSPLFKNATKQEQEQLLKDFRLAQKKEELLRRRAARDAGKKGGKKDLKGLKAWAEKNYKKAAEWAKKNPKLAAGIGVGAAGVTGGGAYYASRRSRD